MYGWTTRQKISSNPIIFNAWSTASHLTISNTCLKSSKMHAHFPLLALLYPPELNSCANPTLSLILFDFRNLVWFLEMNFGSMVARREANIFAITCTRNWAVVIKRRQSWLLQNKHNECMIKRSYHIIIMKKVQCYHDYVTFHRVPMMLENVGSETSGARAFLRGIENNENLISSSLENDPIHALSSSDIFSLNSTHSFGVRCSSQL